MDSVKKIKISNVALTAPGRPRLAYRRLITECNALRRQGDRNNLSGVPAWWDYTRIPDMQCRLRPFNTRLSSADYEVHRYQSHRHHLHPASCHFSRLSGLSRPLSRGSGPTLKHSDHFRGSCHATTPISACSWSIFTQDFVHPAPRLAACCAWISRYQRRYYGVGIRIK